MKPNESQVVVSGVDIPLGDLVSVLIKPVRVVVCCCLGLLTSCVRDQVPTVTVPVYSTRLIEATDSSGVGSASCPTTHRIVGGGCHCEGIGDVLFGGDPAGNGFVCGCYDFGAAGGSVTVSAICLGSSDPSTLKQGLSVPDPELERVVAQFKAQRAR